MPRNRHGPVAKATILKEYSDIGPSTIDIGAPGSDQPAGGGGRGGIGGGPSGG